MLIFIRYSVIMLSGKKLSRRTNILPLSTSARELLLLVHTFSVVLSLQLKKLRRRNESAIDLSNVNPARSHKEVRRSTGQIMVTTRYSDQHGSKSRQKVMRHYKQWHRPINAKTVHHTSLLHNIENDLDRLELLSPTHGQRSQQQSG